MPKNNNYQPGNPEYDYWNDKSLYPSLQHDNDALQLPRPANAKDAEISLGSVFLTIFVWILVFAPFAFFLTWENWILQVIFWGGLAITVLVFLAWLCGAIEAEKQRKK